MPKEPKERVVILAGGFLFLLVVIWPPWLCAFNGGPQLEKGYYKPMVRPIGHHLIFVPPSSNDPKYFEAIFDGEEVYLDPHFYEFRIDFVRLTVLLVSIVLLTGVALFLTRH